MKLIIAYVRPERLAIVKAALHEVEIYRMSVTNALGCGAEGGYHESYRGSEMDVDLLKKVRFEIAVNKAFERKAIEAITTGARTGEIGDGKIFVIDLDRVIRIRTGEEGAEAIG